VCNGEGGIGEGGIGEGGIGEGGIGEGRRYQGIERSHAQGVGVLARSEQLLRSPSVFFFDLNCDGCMISRVTH